MRAQVAELRRERETLAAAVAALPGTTVFPSAGNFVLVRVPDADFAYETLLDARILVKNVGKMHASLTNCVRLTVGTTAQNAQLLAALRRALT